jgi:PAS domain S-box-containing protein
MAERKSEESIFQSTDLFKSLVENAPDIIARFDRSLRHIYVNPAVERATGRPRHEFIGKTNADLGMPQHLCSYWAERMEAVFLSGESTVAAEFSYETPDGLRFFESYIVPEFKPDGTVETVLAIARDITRLKETEGELKHTLAKVEERIDSRTRELQRVNDALIAEIAGRRDIEEALRKSEEKYRSIFENAVEGVCQTTPEGCCLNLNPAFARMFGYDSPDEMIGTVSDIGQQVYVNPEDRERLKRLLSDKGVVEAFEAQVYRKDGEKIWIAINAHAVRDENGRVLCYEGTAEEITERKKAEQQLKEEKERFSTLSDNTPFGMALVDAQGKFLYINPKFTEIFGYDAHDVPDGKTWFRKAYPDPDRRHAAVAAWIADTRTATIGEKKPRIFTVLCKDGIEKIISFVPVRLTSGEYIMSCEDITQRTVAEEALKASRQSLLDIIEFLPDPTFVIDRQKKVIAWNRATEEMTGCGKEAMLGKGDQEYAIPFYGVRRPVLIDLVLERNEEVEKRYEHMTLKGKTLYGEGYIPKAYGGRGASFWGVAAPLFDTTGAVIGAIESMRDITELKKSQTALEESIERLRRSVGATIDVIVMAVETRDPYTAGHQKRVANLARAMATEMGLSHHQIDGVRMAGTIHDLGKISIPAEILSTPRTLSDIEFSLIKAHPEIGYGILKDIEFPWPIAQIVLQHHERINGSGYPHGLRGEEILLEARIIAVADVVEAIASNRPYRPAYGIDMALSEIEKNKGVLYDPEAVDTCLKLFVEKRFEFG